MYEALVAVEAHPNLIAWASAEARDHHDATGLLSLNQDPVWSIWICAAAGVPLRALVDAALREVSQAVERLTEARATLSDVLRLSSELRRGSGDGAAVLAAADRADAIAASHNASDRTHSTQPTVTPTATACSYVARACEALYSVEQSLASQRMLNAQRSAAMVGVGASALAGGRAPWLCLNPEALPRDPVQRVALFVPAAVAEAVAQLLAAEQQAASETTPAAAMNARLGSMLTPFLRT